MIDSSGIDIAKAAITHNPAVQIIFISAYDTYYTDVYVVDHIYFLRKPIDPKGLMAAFTCAKEKIAKESTNFFTVAKKQGIWKIPLSSIYFFERKGRQVLIYNKNTVIDQFYGKFPTDKPNIQESFVRCHNSYLVNLSKIHSLSNNVLKLENGMAVNISRSRHQETKLAFAAYLERTIPHIF